MNASLSGLTISGGVTKGSGDGPGSTTGYGAGLRNFGTVTLYGCTISGNYDQVDGGGVANLGSATLANCTISGNSTQGTGGGVVNDSAAATLELSASIVSGNYANEGGGVDNFGLGIATITGCTVSGNTAVEGGGVTTYRRATTLSDSTISGNTGVFGGGGVSNFAGTDTLTNCTISDNSALGYAGGGLQNYGTTTLTACTISGNSAELAGGIGIEFYGSSPVVTTLTDTIVAGNTASGRPSDIGGSNASSVTGSYNLVGTGGSGGLTNSTDGNQVGVANPLLGALGDYGGPTETMPLLPGSPAIGAGTAIGGITIDQRGFALDSPTPDIGAFQTNPLVVSTTIDGSGSPFGDLSLRQAVNLANVLDAAEVITFSASVFATAQTITLDGSQLELRIPVGPSRSPGRPRA